MAWGEIKKFGWVKQRSAYQDMEYHRAKRAAFASDEASSLDSINNAVATAMQNKISGLSNLAGNAALKRVQAAAKAKAEQAQKQIDQTLKGLDSAQKTADAAGVLDTEVDSTGKVVDVTA